MIGEELHSRIVRLAFVIVEGAECRVVIKGSNGRYRAGLLVGEQLLVSAPGATPKEAGLALETILRKATTLPQLVRQ